MIDNKLLMHSHTLIQGFCVANIMAQYVAFDLKPYHDKTKGVSITYYSKLFRNHDYVSFFLLIGIAVGILFVRIKTFVAPIKDHQ